MRRLVWAVEIKSRSYCNRGIIGIFGNVVVKVSIGLKSSEIGPAFGRQKRRVSYWHIKQGCIWKITSNPDLIRIILIPIETSVLLTCHAKRIIAIGSNYRSIESILGWNFDNDIVSQTEWGRQIDD